MIYLGPSAAKRWLRCTASPGYLVREKHRIERRDTDYADEGIEAHDWAKMALQLGGMFDYGTIKDKEMRVSVQGYVEFVLAQLEPGDELIVEEKAPLFYMPKRNGIVDASVVKPTKLIINDLKYGAGISVEAEDNEQLAIYARSQIDRLVRKGYSFAPRHEMELNIYQPRARDDRTQRQWRLTLTELYKFCDRIATIATDIIANPNGGVFFPDEDVTCQFCDAKSFCTSRAKSLLGELPDEIVPVQSLELVSAEHAELKGFPAVQSLTVEQIAKVLTVRSGLKSWLDEVSDYARSMASAGQKIPGYKMVEGKSNRVWADEKEAERVLGYRLTRDEMFPRSFISPAQAEKLLKDRKLTTRLQNMLDKAIIKPGGANTLVPESDSRPDIQIDPTKEFDNLESTENLL